MATSRSRPKVSWGRRAAGALRALGRFLARRGVSLLRRAYALALIALILWLSAGAILYLVQSLIIPSAAPPQVTGLPKVLDVSLLKGPEVDWRGLAAVEHPRSPLAHFHQFETWIQSDPLNDCTRSGCHAPLPHSQRKQVRAFLNMHATSLHCGVCHLEFETQPLPLVWYGLADGRPRARPALLDVLAWLEARPQEPERYGPVQQREIVALLTAASNDFPGEWHLPRLAADLSAVRAGSDSFLALLSDTDDAVRRALRGSYAAKIARRDPAGGPILGNAGTEAAIQAWLERGATATGAAREAMLQAVHPRRRETALQCTDCHRAQGGLLDFAALGYPAARIRSLTEPSIFTMIENIAAGRAFELPSVGRGLFAPQSQPAPRPAP